MKKIVTLILLLTCLNSYCQKFTLLEINARWNEHNNLSVNKLADIKIQFAWLEDQPNSIQRNVISVPTLILMKEGRVLPNGVQVLILNYKLQKKK